MLHGLLSLIRGYDTKLSELELAIVDALCANISDEYCLKLKSRISYVNMIKRSDGGREVILYNRRRGVTIFNDDFAISKLPGASKFAKFKILSNDKMTKNNGYIILMNGNLASIEYKNPTEHAEISHIKEIEISIIDKLII